LVHRTNSDRRPDGPDGRSGIAAPAPAGADEGAAGAGSNRSASPWSAVRSPWLAWGGGLLLVGIGLFSLYLRQSRVAPFNSDGASIMLQAQSMLHGNLLLSGWWTADVTFYTTEIPEYMLVELFRGLHPDVVHICGALTYTLIVLLGAMLARGRVKGRAGVVRALLAGGIMLAPGVIGGTPVFLENPDHAGTAVPILLLLLILDRAAERWYVPVAVCALLAWIQVADQLSLVAATAPIAAVAVVRLGMLALRRRPLAEYRYDALLLVAAVASDGLAKVAVAAIRHFGGYVIHPLPQHLLAPSSQVPSNARVMGQTLLLLFGANNLTGAREPIEIIARYHLIGLALAACGLAVAIATFFGRRTDRVTQILVAATIATLAAGILGTELPSLAYAHEVAILLPLGAVLAGRMLPGLLPDRWRRGAVRVAVPALGVWLACALAALCWAATWAPLAPQNQALASWLTEHHYTDGLAGYWQANSTTVTSGGAVLVAPITIQANAARHWEASVSWYEPGQRRADFVIAVADPSGVQSGGELTPQNVRKSFGRPAHQYQVGQYLIMVYNHNLLPKLGGRAFPGT
jgi:hypothetical protein